MAYKKLTLRIESQLITWNDVAGFCFSRDSNRYARTKKREQTFIKHEIRSQMADGVRNIFKDYPTRVNYEWHTSGKFDLGNLAAGEKFIADSINELQIWDDDRYTQEISHNYVQDEENYVLVTITRLPKKKAKPHTSI